MAGGCRFFFPSTSKKNKHTGEIREYAFEKLANVTGSFSNKFQIGNGGFGDVYKGTIGGKTYAIKKLRHRATEQQEADFHTEIKALSAVNHDNLVRLIGYCSQSGNRLIVCEYCPNLSLRYQLHDSPETGILSWSKRLEIAIGSARGLKYLHDNAQPKIIHRDIKPDNIVLDKNFQAKVVDFGLAKIFPESGSKTHISSDYKGTEVYADPEHYPNQRVSEKSDVYSFGVVMLELISGRKPEINEVTIIEWAKPLILQVALGNENNISQLIDPKLGKEETQRHRSEMKVMLFCAAASVYKPSNDRPKMSQIVQALEGGIYVPNDIWDFEKDSIP